jgi:hypothetical protein
LLREGIVAPERILDVVPRTRVKFRDRAASGSHMEQTVS